EVPPAVEPTPATPGPPATAGIISLSPASGPGVAPTLPEAALTEESPAGARIATLVESAAQASALQPPMVPATEAQASVAARRAKKSRRARRKEERAISKEERTRRPGWLSRLIHWG